MNGSSVDASTTGNVQATAPALFTASATGTGVAAALAIQGPGTTPIFSCSALGCVSTPILLSAATPTFLSLYGTGIRNRSSVANVSASIGGITVPVQYAGAQGSEAGLDQVNLALPAALRGMGETDLVLTVDGQTANTVRVNIN